MPDYRESGVDFNSVGRFRSSLINEMTFKGNKYKRATDLGHYSGLISFMGNYIALHTDNVGTKTMMALKFKYFDEMGKDLVGMNANDMVCIGAEPMAMVDYIAGSVLSPGIGSKLGKSINEACKEAGITMIGGETASVPDLVKGIDISGTVVGYLEKGKEITGKRVKEGDRIIGLESSGIHSNGFSLIRKIYEKREESLLQKFQGKPLWKELLKGTRIYSKDIFELTKEFNIHGIAHITGGGVRNILRLKEMRYRLNYPDPPPIFERITRDGSISTREAFQVFNMGIGMVIIVPKKDKDSVFQNVGKYNPIDLGEVCEGKGLSIDNFNLKYDSYY